MCSITKLKHSQKSFILMDHTKNLLKTGRLYRRDTRYGTTSSAEDASSNHPLGLTYFKNGKSLILTASVLSCSTGETYRNKLCQRVIF